MANLPEGIFRRCRLSSDEAKALIEQARQQATLFCVSDEDLLAPYCKRAAEKHKELRDVLSEHSAFICQLTISRTSMSQKKVIRIMLRRSPWRRSAKGPTAGRNVLLHCREKKDGQNATVRDRSRQRGIQHI